MTRREPGPPRRYDLDYRSIPNVVRESAARHGAHPALVEGDRRWSYAEVCDAMMSVARAFRSGGIEPGDRVAIWAPNCAEWIFAALGALSVGGVLVPLNTRLRGEEAAEILARSGARCLVSMRAPSGADGLELLGQVASDLPAMEDVIVVGSRSPGGPSARTWEAFLADGEQTTNAEVDGLIDGLGPEDLSDIMFTSGTTGRAKGVMLTHGGSLRCHGLLSDIVGLGPTDRFLVVPPFSHTFGYKAGWMAAFMHGEATLRLIERSRISVLHGPPTLFRDLIDHPRRDEFDLSSLRATIPSAANVPPSLIEELREVLGFQTIISCYGFTEAHSAVTANTREDRDEDVSGTVGRPLPGIEVQVADEQGIEVERGRPGEVLVRGFNRMVGYWDDPDATAKAIDPQGWIHSGDVGVMDDRGFLRITDRIKDLYIVGGFNVYPAEVERVLLAHDAVRDVAVVGRGDARLGEVGAAFVVLRPGTSPSPEDLIAWARTRLANYKVPRSVHFLDALPRNASMKVVKGDLRSMLEGGTA
jgi:HIP---CoA ligase